MATYKIKASYWDGASLYTADEKHPAVITVPDSQPPSRSWEPLDEAARSALVKLIQSDAEKVGRLIERSADKDLLACHQNRLDRIAEALERAQKLNLAAQCPAPTTDRAWKAGLKPATREEKASEAAEADGKRVKLGRQHEA